ncbi:hypothetical protein SCUCBS95973_001365 [Sporothrix curviconia]|uniref:Beta-lactamase-related domain-containing protein n=1 Tax=Sporothrix curviconia TaxID=1260050 RepID=A0ABP0AY30_9PEZI
MTSSDPLHRRLDGLRPAIEALMRLGSTPGLSLAVVDGADDSNVYYAGFGVRDVASGLPVTKDTRFPACSLAKAVSATAMGLLVADGRASSWDMLAKDAVPEFAGGARDAALRDTTTLADLFSHRSGMSSVGALVGGSEANVLVATQADMLRAVNEQILLPERRGKFFYNSTAYDLCGAAIEQLSSASVAEFVDKRIFRPLGMQRSSMEPPGPANADDNTCSCYNVLDDGTPVRIPGPRVGENGVGAASGGLWTCTRDLVALYRAMLRDYHGQHDTPLQGAVRTTMTAHVPMSSDGQAAYGLGWARTQLPSTLGQIGLNGRLLPGGMPTVGNGLGRRPVIIYHQGTLPGALACALLLPETDQIVVLLSNSLALTDVPDWTVHLVVEELLGVPKEDRVDVMAYARQSIAVNLAWYDGVQQGLALAPTAAERAALTHPLEAYAGTYADYTGIFRVVVTLDKGQLFWAFQGLASERYALSHYDGDTFTWLQPRNALVRRGRWVLGDDTNPEFWKVVFCSSGSRPDTITSVRWSHDPALRPVEYIRNA